MILEYGTFNRNILRIATEIIVAMDSKGLTEKFKGLNSVFTSIDISTIDMYLKSYRNELTKGNK